MTIIEFLLARIAEDEAVAAAVRPDEYLTTRDRRDLRPSRVGPHATVACTSTRVLAECAAKRQIIKHCTETLEDSSGGYTSGALLAERVLSAMAAVYANHPDYDPDPEWRLQ